VQVGASSINYRDLVTIEDPIQRNIKFPMIPNFDCAGEVLARPGGPKCIIWQKSHRMFFQGWVEGPITPVAMSSALGGALEGVLAEQVTPHATVIIKC